MKPAIRRPLSCSGALSERATIEQTATHAGLASHRPESLPAELRPGQPVPLLPACVRRIAETEVMVSLAGPLAEYLRHPADWISPSHVRRGARRGARRARGPSLAAQGWKLAAAIIPIAYIAWSLWLIISGLVLLVG